MKFKSSKYRIGFVYDRSGVAYTEIAGIRKSTKLVFSIKNKSDLIEILEERIRQHLNPSNNIGKGNYTWHDLVNKFLAEHNLPKKSINEIRYAVNYYLSDNYYLTDVEGMRQAIISNSDNKLAVNSHNRYISNLKRIFTYGISEGLLDRQIINNSMLKSEMKEVLHTFTDDEMNLILDNCTNKQLYLIIKLISFTGMRINEALNLKKEDITERCIIIKETKNKRYRYIPMSLSNDLPKLCDNIIKFGMFTICKEEISRIFSNMLEKLNIKYRHTLFHGIRRYVENKLLQAGYDSRAIADLLGHNPIVQEQSYRQKHNLEQLEKKLNNVL